jgi:FkbM family methyltransferase
MGFKHKLKMFLIKLIPDSFKSTIVNSFKEGAVSYSQEGEDIVLERFLDSSQKGFFVDVGAHHPIRFSNTYRFYLKGWKGLNIDATPKSMDAFKELRKKDVNLEVGVGLTKGILKYYLFDEPALNTFNKERVDYLLNNSNYRLKSQVDVDVKPLSLILEENLIHDQEIDFLSIDVEGLDYEVLLSNDWSKYRPKIILIEDLERTFLNVLKTRTGLFLHELGYVPVAKTFNTVFYKDGNLIEKK